MGMRFNLGSHISAIFYGWVFTPTGIGVFAAIMGAVMLVLTLITEALSAYAPLSYFVAFMVGVILLLITLSLIFFLLEKRTKRTTYVTYDVVKGEFKVTNAANMREQRLFNFPEYNIDIMAVWVTFDSPIYPSSTVDVTAIRGNPPSIYKQYINENGVVIFIRSIDPNSSFKLTFNRAYN